MKKTFKVVMLPTEKEEGCIIKTSDNVLVYQKNPYLVDGEKLQHLYIISDGELKEGDCNIDRYDNVKQASKNTIGFVVDRKIVSTTDKGLVWENSFIDGKQINKIVLSQIPELLIKDYIEAYNSGKPITEVDLEMEYNKLYPMVENNNIIIKTRPDNTVIWSIVAETINN
jgi:hypothetical protein